MHVVGDNPLHTPSPPGLADGSNSGFWRWWTGDDDGHPDLRRCTTRPNDCQMVRPSSGATRQCLTPLASIYNLVVMKASAALDATFAALADPTRRAILARLATGAATVGELGEPFDMSQPAISKHLKVLERAGLISQAQDA